jgi:hypothetical protein
MTIFCGQCRAERVHTVEGPNHILHLIVSLLTVGLWLIGWLVVVLMDRKELQCERCGSRTSR